jgi:hemoglobin
MRKCARWTIWSSDGVLANIAAARLKRRSALRRPTGTCRISPAEFDEVAAELGRTLDFFKVPTPEKAEVLAAFAAHKDEVTAGYVAAAKRG